MDRNHSLPYFLILCLLTSFIGAVFAQDQVPESAPAVDNSNQGFALFEGIETAEARNAAPTRRTNRQSRATIAEPEFTLLGTSRIGDKYSAILQHKDGEAILVKTSPGSATTIPDHGDYRVVSVAAGTVSIRYPGSNTCVEFSDRGITCDEADNTANLALVASEPLAPRNPPQRLATQSSEGRTAAGGNSDGAQEEVINPFATLREAEVDGADGGTAPSNRFSPRRIAPEDVPPGMRVVSTPFGDRLVEQ